MKTIKIKINLSQDQIKIYEQCIEEMEWLWNKILEIQLYNHSLAWYEWAEKKAQREISKTKKSKSDRNSESTFLSFSLEGIIRCPLQFQNSGFIGASCKIAVGGSSWQKDESIKIEYKNGKKEICYRPGYKLVAGDRPYTRIKPEEHSFKFVIIDGEAKMLKQTSDFDRLKVLNKMREMDRLPELVTKTDYISGLIQKDFDVAWKAFLDPNLSNRKKPKFKGKNFKIKTLTNNQNPPKIDFEKGVIKLTNLGEVRPGDRSWKRRLTEDKFIPRTYAVTKEPSGFYICITIAHPATEQKKSLEKKLIKAKKAEGLDGQEYQDIKNQIQTIDAEIASSSKTIKKSEKPIYAGVEPGFDTIAIALDNGALFRPNISRERIEVHIEKLQSQLSRIKQQNDKNWEKAGHLEKRSPTKNEQKLQAKISRLHERARNSSSAYNHKLATRLARTYRKIAWKSVQLQSLMQQGDLNNRTLRTQAIGDLKTKTKQKLEKMGGEFIEVSGDRSLKCFNCGEEGNTENHFFICQNQVCCKFNIKQLLGVNAAKNHRKSANLPQGVDIYQEIEISSFKRPKHLREKKAKIKSKK